MSEDRESDRAVVVSAVVGGRRSGIGNREVFPAGVTWAVTPASDNWRTVANRPPTDRSAAMISFICPECSGVVRAPHNAIGRLGTCPKCKRKVEIPNRKCREPAANHAATFDAIEDDPWEPPVFPPPSPPTVASRRAGIPRESNGHFAEDIVAFRTMVTMPVVRIVWILGAVGLTCAWIYFVSLMSESAEDFSDFAWILAIFVFNVIWGNIVWRIFCEVLILFFKMHDALEELVDGQRQR